MKNAISAAPAGADDVENLISRQELARLFELSVSGVDDLAARGIVQKTGTVFLLTESVAGYVRHLKAQLKAQGQSVADEKAGLIRAQREKAELVNAKTRGELLPAADVERTWIEIIMDVRARMLSVPSRVQAKLGHLTAHDVAAIDDEVRAALTEGGNDGL